MWLIFSAGASIFVCTNHIFTFFLKIFCPRLITSQTYRLHVAGRRCWRGQTSGRASERSCGAIRHFKIKTGLVSFIRKKQPHHISRRRSQRAAIELKQAGSLFMLTACSNALENVQKYETQYYRIKRSWAAAHKFHYWVIHVFVYRIYTAFGGADKVDFSYRAFCLHLNV